MGKSEEEILLTYEKESEGERESEWEHARYVPL